MSAASARGPIVAGDRVSDVLARDESLVEIFAGVAPAFAKLRNRAMRRVMARLVTVEQAARMGGVNTDALLRALNAALGASSGGGAHAAPAPSGRGNIRGDASPEHASDTHPLHAAMVELDVRDDLRAGREPFSQIMAAVRTLADDTALHLRTLFEPVPLYAVLGKRGFHHEAAAHAADDWSVWFWRPAGEAAPAAADRRDTDGDRSDSAADVDTGSAPNAVALDVRGLEPPDPLLRTLEALESLPAGGTLVQVNVRVPQVLLPMLAERGFAYEIDETRPDVVLVRIRHIA